MAAVSSCASASAARAFVSIGSTFGSCQRSKASALSACRPQRSLHASSSGKPCCTSAEQLPSRLENISESRIQAVVNPSRRKLLVGTGLGVAMASTGDVAGPSASAAEGTGASALPKVPKGKEIAPGLAPSAVIKGCWQLAGGLCIEEPTC